MTRIPPAVVGETYASTFGWETLEKLVTIGNRHPGQQGEREGTAVVEQALESVGLEPESSEFDVPGWWRGETELTLTEVSPGRTFDKQHQILAHPCTEQCHLEAPLIDVGHGAPEDFKSTDTDGAIVVASSDDPPGQSISGMEKHVRAAQGGAEAFILRTHIEGALPPTGSNEPNLIPAFSVSREVGVHLLNYADRSDTHVELQTDPEIQPSTSQNVEATLGPETDEEILVSAHVDSHDINDGARDNGVGCAVVVELANQLRKIEPDLGTQVRFVLFGAEEIGLYGAHHWVQTNNLGAVKALINIDGAGGTSRVKIDHHIFEELGDNMEQTIAKELSLPVEKSDETTGDAWAFVQHGVPSVTVRTVPENDHDSYDPGRGWGHTHGDTIDKLDRHDIRDLTIQVLVCVIALADEQFDTSHRPRKAVRATIDEHKEWLLRAIGRWPFEDMS